MFLVTRNRNGAESSQAVHEEVAFDMVKNLKWDLDAMADGDFFMIRRADYLETQLDTNEPDEVDSDSAGRTYGHLTVFDGG